MSLRNNLLYTLAFLLPLGAAVNAQEGPVTMQYGDFEAKITSPNEGIKVYYQGKLFSDGNAMWVVKPNWSGQHYGTPQSEKLMERARVEEVDGGMRLYLPQDRPSDPDCPAKGWEAVTFYDEGAIEYSLHMELIKNVPGQLEWCAGMIPTIPFEGYDYIVTTQDGEKTGTIALQGNVPTHENSNLAHNFSSFQIDSRFGPLTITTSSDLPFDLLDYRGRYYADPNKPRLWLGHVASDIKVGKAMDFSVKITFPNASENPAVAVKQKKAKAKLKETDQALAPASVRKPLIPSPKEVNYTDGAFTMKPDTTMNLGTSPSEGIIKAGILFQEELNTISNLDVAKAYSNDIATSNSITAGHFPIFNAPLEFCVDKELTPPMKPEGYTLIVTPDNIVISANNDRGVFNGFMTLSQLLYRELDGTVTIPCVEIRDWPSLQMRAVHLFTSKFGPEELNRTLRKILTPYKINTLVLESQYINWDSHPELAHPTKGMKKAEAKQIIHMADKCNLDLIPLVQGYGHTDWMFANGENLDLAEDPSCPYTFDPTNERSYEILFDVYEEAIELFNPSILHIGHDEVGRDEKMNGGTWPLRNKDGILSPEEMVVSDTLRTVEWLQDRGIRTMLWGDMFLAPGESPDATNAETAEEAKRMRDALPKDVIFADWHYAPTKPAEYKSLSILQDAGFQSLGCGWYTVDNIRNLTQACIDTNSMGYMQTTWAGFNFMLEGNEESWHQFWSYILAAEYSWSGKTPSPEDLPYNVQEVFVDALYPQKNKTSKHNGYLLDLSSLANRSLADSDDKDGWVGFGSQYDLSTVPTGINAFKGTEFLVNEKALMLHGR
jgi:hexosaminidase